MKNPRLIAGFHEDDVRQRLRNVEKHWDRVDLFKSPLCPMDHDSRDQLIKTLVKMGMIVVMTTANPFDDDDPIESYETTEDGIKWASTSMGPKIGKQPLEKAEYPVINALLQPSRVDNNLPPGSIGAFMGAASQRFRPEDRHRTTMGRGYLNPANIQELEFFFALSGYPVESYEDRDSIHIGSTKLIGFLREHGFVMDTDDDPYPPNHSNQKFILSLRDYLSKLSPAEVNAFDEIIALERDHKPMILPAIRDMLPAPSPKSREKAEAFLELRRRLFMDSNDDENVVYAFLLGIRYDDALDRTVIKVGTSKDYRRRAVDLAMLDPIPYAARSGSTAVEKLAHNKLRASLRNGQREIFYLNHDSAGFLDGFFSGYQHRNEKLPFGKPGASFHDLLKKTSI